MLICILTCIRITGYVDTIAWPNCQDQMILRSVTCASKCCIREDTSEFVCDSSLLLRLSNWLKTHRTDILNMFAGLDTIACLLIISTNSTIPTAEGEVGVLLRISHFAGANLMKARSITLAQISFWSASYWKTLWLFVITSSLLLKISSILRGAYFVMAEDSLSSSNSSGVFPQTASQS